MMEWWNTVCQYFFQKTWLVLKNEAPEDNSALPTETLTCGIILFEDNCQFMASCRESFDRLRRSWATFSILIWRPRTLLYEFITIQTGSISTSRGQTKFDPSTERKTNVAANTSPQVLRAASSITTQSGDILITCGLVHEKSAMAVQERPQSLKWTCRTVLYATRYEYINV